MRRGSLYGRGRRTLGLSYSAAGDTIVVIGLLRFAGLTGTWLPAPGDVNLIALVIVGVVVFGCPSRAVIVVASVVRTSLGGPDLVLGDTARGAPDISTGRLWRG
jgi:hypothetical protein